MSSDERGRTLYLAVFAAMLTSAATTYGLRALEGPPAPPAEVAEEAPEVVAVPAVLGLAQATAQELVRSRGLRVVVASEEASAEVAAGHVLRQEPMADSEVPSGSAVNIVLSTGAPLVALPSLVGQSLEEARSAIEELGLTVGDVSEDGEGTEPGTVTAQTPPAGEVEAGTSVALTATPAGIEVPDLAPLRYRQARSRIEELGLEVGNVRRRYTENLPDFAIREQEPAPGTRVAPGTPVNLVIND